MNLLASIELRDKIAALAAMQRAAILLAGALLSEDSGSFLRYTYDAEALFEEWEMTEEMRVWAHDTAASYVPEEQS